MKRLSRFSKRTWVLVGVIAAVAAIASVGAYAYWTTGGSGSGTASTGDTTDNLVPACRPCNSRRGAIYTNRKRAAPAPPSRDW